MKTYQKKGKSLRIQQFHESSRSAKKQIDAWNKDYHSSWNRDFGDYGVVSIRKARKGIYGGKNEKTPTGRFLYNISLRKK